MAVPSEGAFVELELVPALHGGHGARVDEGHASGDMRGSGQFGFAHVGHPDAEALLLVARGVGGIPAQARHRGGGGTSLFKLGRVEQSLGNAVVVEGVEGEVAHRARHGAVAHLGLERLTRGATAHLRAVVVVIGGRAGQTLVLITEVLVEGNLAVLTVQHGGAQQNIVLKRQLVNGIVAFRNLRERQRVVVVKLRIRHKV